MQELEDEIYEKLEELRQREQQNSELMQKFEQIEDETYRQARKAKEVNDALFDAYAKDKRLISLLTEKEEELHQKQILDRLFFADMRDEFLISLKIWKLMIDMGENIWWQVEDAYGTMEI